MRPSHHLKLEPDEDVVTVTPAEWSFTLLCSCATRHELTCFQKKRCTRDGLVLWEGVGDTYVAGVYGDEISCPHCNYDCTIQCPGQIVQLSRTLSRYW